MKKLLTYVLLIGLALNIHAQDWQFNFEKAKALASKENKHIVLVFSGSDWCSPCIKLEKNIWESAAFQKAAKENWILLKADFPRKKANKLPKDQAKENEMLAEKYNPNGYFPLVQILDATGKIIGTTAYKDYTPTEYIKHLHSFD